MTKFFFKRYSARYTSATEIKEVLIDDDRPQGGSVKWSKKERKKVESVLTDFWSNISRNQEDERQDREQSRAVVYDAVRKLMEKENLGLNPNDKNKLCTDPTKDEVWEAIDSFKLEKAPGKNSLPGEYYKIHYDRNGGDSQANNLLEMLLNVYKECEEIPEEGEKLWTKSMRQSLVRLLFKKTNDIDRILKKNYRPITLQNLNYKIFYKILTNRLTPLIYKLIPKSQHAFVPQKLISDPIHIILLLMHRARQMKLKHAIIFADIMKAFDQVGHIFAIGILEVMGLPPRFIEWVKMSLGKLKFS
jgi:hypothetical protein